jgi:hypothetical protein
MKLTRRGLLSGLLGLPGIAALGGREAGKSVDRSAEPGHLFTCGLSHEENGVDYAATNTTVAAVTTSGAWFVMEVEPEVVAFKWLDAATGAWRDA